MSAEARPFMTVRGGHTCRGESTCLHYLDQLVTILAEAADTRGAYGLLTGELPPGSGPPPHTHSREDEAFYVVAGRLHAWVGEQYFDAGPGSFIFLPRGVVHWFEAIGPGTTTVVCIVSPGGHERMFRALGTETNEPVLPPPPREFPIQRIVAEAARVGVDVTPTHKNWHLKHAPAPPP